MPRVTGSDDGTAQLVPADADASRAAPRDIPALPQDTTPLFARMRGPLEALREAVQTLLGYRGDPLDRALTLRLAQQKGMLDLRGHYLGGGSTIIQPPPTGGGGGTTEPDLTPPPNVTNLRAAAGFTQVIVEWDAATYTQGHGHAKTNLYAVRKEEADPTQPTAGDAVRVAEATGALTIFALPSEMGMRWHLWAKYETKDGVESLAFAGGIHGVQVTTGRDIGRLLNALTGSIRDSELVASLRGRVSAAGRAGAKIADDAIAAVVAAHRAGRQAQQGITLVRREVTERIVAGERAEASARELLAATVGQNTAALATESKVRAAQTGHLGAQWTVRMVLASGGTTVAGGFGLSGSSSANAGTTIRFGVLANQFFVGAPDDGSDVPGAFPFIVQTTPTTLNGVPVPVGVYMDTAFIRDGSITNVKIGNAAIDDAKVANLSAAKLTVGDGTVGGNLKSANYVGGSNGWLLRPDGFAEFGFNHIRGTLLASQVAAGSINAGHLAAGAVTADKLAAGSVTADKIAAGSINADKIAAGSVTTEKLVLGSVSSPYSIRAGDTYTSVLLPSDSLLWESAWMPAITGVVLSRGVLLLSGAINVNIYRNVNNPTRAVAYMVHATIRAYQGSAPSGETQTFTAKATTDYSSLSGEYLVSLPLHLSRSGIVGAITIDYGLSVRGIAYGPYGGANIGPEVYVDHQLVLTAVEQKA